MVALMEVMTHPAYPSPINYKQKQTSVSEGLFPVSLCLIDSEKNRLPSIVNEKSVEVKLIKKFFHQLHF